MIRLDGKTYANPGDIEIIPGLGPVRDMTFGEVREAIPILEAVIRITKGQPEDGDEGVEQKVLELCFKIRRRKMNDPSRRPKPTVSPTIRKTRTRKTKPIIGSS